MRLGLDLRGEPDPDRRRALAIEADRFGLWAVLVGGRPGTETTEAAALATVTADVHLAVWLDASSVHPVGLAEEVAVLDHLSERRALAVVDGPDEVVAHVERLLAGEIVNGVALTPPPAQTRVSVWPTGRTRTATLTGEPDRDRATVEQFRDDGVTHLFVTWPGPVATLARHLVPPAAEPSFPRIVADLADVVDPPT